MRTVTFKSVYESIVRMHGMDPRGDAVSTDTGLSISDNLNARVQTAWFAWEWPEWTITEERAFRQIWNDSRQFYQMGVDGKPDEVFYIPNVATQSLVGAAYYRVKEDALDNPPIGTDPSDTTYWEPMDTVDTYIAFDQVCRRRIGEVLDVYANNPAICKPPRCLGHRVNENGVQVYEAGGLLTVFVRYLIPAEQFTTFPYIASRTYLRGDTVYVADEGECYQAIQLALGKDPVAETSYWRRCLFPAVLAQYVQLGTYGDCLLESDTSDERDPVMLQIRGQNASRARADADDEINRQINRLQAQGQHYSYLPFGVVVAKTALFAGAFYSVPGYVLQGGGAYGYGPIAPTGSGTTTLSDQCETAWGYIPPAPPIVTVQVPIANQRGMVQLVLGQGYVDVVFHSSQTNANWILVECEIVNTTDATPLNIAPGIITSRTLTGFRIQLEGLPDTGNYFLRWAINGNIVPPAPATTYALSGPTSGRIGAAATFTVELLADTTVTDPVTVTPSDGGGGGTFSPTSVELTTMEPSVTFIYTPGLYGDKTISVTNDGGLTDPADLTFTSLASTYTLAGPSAGLPGVASTNFTVALPAGGVVAGTVTVTPHDGGGGGAFTPTSLNLTTVAPSATFTYTPATAGTKTISVTNNGGLTDPGNISYVATAPFDPATIAGMKLWLKADALGLTDGATVSPWTDSSGMGNNAAQTQGTGIYKTNIVNGKPIVRFNGATGFSAPLAVLSTATAYTVFTVQSAASISSGSHAVMQAGGLIIRRDAGDLNVFLYSGSTFPTVSEAGGIVAGAWNIVSTDWNGANIHMWKNGTLKGTTAATVMANVSTGTDIGYNSAANNLYWDGDIAEVIIYNSALSTTDRQNVENFLKAKYGIP